MISYIGHLSLGWAVTSDQLLEARDHLLLGGPLAAVVVVAAAVGAGGGRIVEEILEEMVDFWNNHSVEC